MVRLVFIPVKTLKIEVEPENARIAPGDFRLEFEVPWADLLAGKPVTLKVPYEDESDQGYKGAWTITFASKSAEK